MAGPITQAGGTVEPSEYAALSMDAQFTGLWTQRNPLRDADVPYLYRKFYSASRFDSMIDGLNREITTRLTDARRPGNSPYSGFTFPPANSMYSFKWQQSGERLRVMYDGTDGVVYDATAGQKSTVFTKSAGSGKTRFLGLSNSLHMYNGVDTVKWVKSSLAWTALTTFKQGQFVIDTNLNVQQAIGAQTATIVNIQVIPYNSGFLAGSLVTLYLSGANPFTEAIPAMNITLSGLTTVPSQNGQTVQVDAFSSNLVVTYFLAIAIAPVAFSAETGTATTGNGQTGAVQPTWSPTQTFVTVDGGAQWINRGSAVRPIGYAAPTVAPAVSQAAAPALYQPWAAATWYGPASIVIVDSNGNVQQLTTSGVTGGGAPAWNMALGGTTADNTAVWTNRGPAAWVASTVYAVGSLVAVTFTYTITSYISIPYPPYYQQTTRQVTVTVAFQVVIAGTSGVQQPSWTAGGGTTVADGTATWRNIGTPLTWIAVGAAQTVSINTTISDSNGNLEAPQNVGKSAAAAPTWSLTQGATTADPGSTPITWQNNGPYAKGNTAPWVYAYSGKDSVTGDVTTASPISLPIVQAASKQVVIQGQGMATNLDTIILWRTAQGESTLVQLDQFTNPGVGQTWIYTDTTPDVANAYSPGLSATVIAPVASQNDPPPSTGTAPEYHVGRVWIIDGFFVRYSGGPDTITGNGNDTFPPLNFFQLPEQPIRLKSITLSGGGLLVVCLSNTYIILGEGTASSPFLRPKMYMARVGAMNYDAIDMVGTTLYVFTNTNKVVSCDVGNGYIENGFPIGDQFTLVTTGGISSALYNPASTFISWHEKNSGDTAMYVSDGAVGWFRYSPIAPPESGSLWSPRAGIVGGTSAVQSIETAPGIFNLLIAPASTGQIRMRDPAQTGDWNGASYTAFPSWDVKGSIGLCETGEVAEIAHIALKSIAVGARPTVSLLLDEIKPGVTVEGTTTAFDVLDLDATHHEDPPNIAPSVTMFSDRYSALSSGTTPKCQNFQLKIDYGSQLAADELLAFAVYGATSKERKQQ